LAEAKYVFVNGKNKDCHEEVKTIVGGFTFDSSWALPV
jgi:hypothetical protein